MELKILDAFGFPNYAVTDNGYVWSIRNQNGYVYAPIPVDTNM